jgi:hypothetical protein
MSVVEKKSKSRGVDAGRRYATTRHSLHSGIDDGNQIHSHVYKSLGRNETPIERPGSSWVSALTTTHVPAGTVSLIAQATWLFAIRQHLTAPWLERHLVNLTDAMRLGGRLAFDPV